LTKFYIAGRRKTPKKKPSVVTTVPRPTVKEPHVTVKVKGKNMKAMVPKDRFNSKGTTEGWRGTTESIADNIRAGSSAADRALQNEDKTRPAPRTLDYELAKFHMQTLKGKVLTIIDAIAFDVEQRKAVKDLVKGAFAEQRQRIQSFCYAGTGLGESIEESDFVF
jgi:flavodoxin